MLAGGCSSVASDTYSLASLLIYMYEEMSLPLPHQAALWAKEAVGRLPEKRISVNSFLKSCNPLSIDYKRKWDTKPEMPSSGRRKTNIAEELQPLYSPVTCKGSKYRKTYMVVPGRKASSDMLESTLESKRCTKRLKYHALGSTHESKRTIDKSEGSERFKSPARKCGS